MRSSLLQCIEEPVQQVHSSLESCDFLDIVLQNHVTSLPTTQVSTQLSVLIARIARIDCPAKWPELLPFLSEVKRDPQS